MSSSSLYENVWGHGVYRATAPGEHLVEQFIKLANPQRHHKVIDFGCGTGRGALKINKYTGAKVLMLDFAGNCLDPEVKKKTVLAADDNDDGFRFMRHDLREPCPEYADFGYCTDVLEHIEPDDVDAVLAGILGSAKYVFLAISTVPDHMGALVGEPLHLTVQPFSWWKERLAKWVKVEWSQDAEVAALFYVKCTKSWADVEKRTALNVEEDRLRANIRANLALGLSEITPHKTQSETEIQILAGGPSLGDYLPDIYENAKAGMPTVTVNGAYGWAIDNGIKPGAQIIVDARGFNGRFVDPVQSQCRYLLSSQCDPSFIATLPSEQVLLWHCAGHVVQEEIERFAGERGYGHEWYPVPGGTTVMLRALPMLAMLGYRKMHIFGFDSCLRASEHHAYRQPENDGYESIDVVVNGKRYSAHGWMLVQATEFQEVARHILNPCDVDLAVYGDGLISGVLAAVAARHERAA